MQFLIRTYNPQEVWSEEVRKTLAPQILKAHLMGDTKALKPWLGEAVYSKLAADIRARKHDGIVFDHNILEIDETQLVMKFLESGNPVIVVVYMVQQINCIRNRKGEIIEVSTAVCWHGPSMVLLHGDYKSYILFIRLGVSSLCDTVVSDTELCVYECGLKPPWLFASSRLLCALLLTLHSAH